MTQPYSLFLRGDQTTHSVIVPELVYFFLQYSGCSSIMPLFALIMFPGGSGNGKGTAQLGQDIAAFLSFQLCLLSGNKKE